MRQVLLPAIRASLAIWLVCGIGYPLLVTGLGQSLFPYQANGSLATAANGRVLGSRLIGQSWTGPQWFHGRPSATLGSDPANPAALLPTPYNAARSGGSNLGPTNRELAERLAADRRAVEAAQPELRGRKLPADMLTASGSGLDPDISPADAMLQVPRVAAARNIAPDRLAALVARDTDGRALDIFGEPHVNVLRLNLDLENGSFAGARRSP